MLPISSGQGGEKQFYRKIVDFSRIQTVIIRVEGNH